MLTFEEIANRFNYHPPGDERTKEKHQFVRDTLKSTANLILPMIPDGREAAMFVTKLEEAMFWANAAIARRK